MAFKASKQTAFHWFHSSKAFNNKRDHRTYAQVAKISSAGHSLKIASNHSNSDPRIVTVNNEKAKPKIVAPSKVSVNAKGCTSPTKPPYSKTWVQTSGVSSIPHQKWFLTNRFHILANLSDDSSSNRYDNTEGSEGDVQPFINNQRKSNNASVHTRSTESSYQAINAKASCSNLQDHRDIGAASLDLTNENTNPSDTPSIVTVSNNSTNSQMATTFLEKTQKHVATDLPETLQKIPLYVWQNKNRSKDHIACLAQNGGDFGYIPLNDLKIYQGPHIVWNKIPDILEAHKIIRDSGVPNFLKSRIPVPTQLNPQRWYFHLRNYWDKQLPDLINYGFPLDFDRNSILQPTYENHR